MDGCACVRDGGGGDGAWCGRREGRVDEGVIGEVEFVADEKEGEVRRGESARVVEEGLEVCEGWVGSYVVDEDGAGGAAVVRAGDGAETFGTGRVPELEFYPFAPRAGANFDDFAGELDADRLGGENAPFILDEAVEETGFSRPARSEQDDLR